jgi:hypothetical protein
MQYSTFWSSNPQSECSISQEVISWGFLDLNSEKVMPWSLSCRFPFEPSTYCIFLGEFLISTTNCSLLTWFIICTSTYLIYQTNCC